MSFFLKLIFAGIMVSSWGTSPLLAQSESKKSEGSGEPSRLDTVASFVFDSERDFGLFISENGALSDKQPAASQLDSIQLDSLFLVLNRDKKVIIPKAHLTGFADFVLLEPSVQPIMAQSLDLLPKDKQVMYSFEVKEGDHFFLRFLPGNGLIQGAKVEVLVNELRVSDEAVLHRNETFSVDFVVARAGKVEVVFKNFGFFKIQGDLSVDIKPRKERIRYLEARQLQLHQEEVSTSVKDTLYLSLFDEAIQVAHKLNLRGKALFAKQLDFLADKRVLGFAVFLYPSTQKEQLEFQRREVYREDPLQDFALKELISKSYTYLPEFELEDLDFSVMDLSQKNHWSNGGTLASESWQSSPNSKRNYAFFLVPDNMKTSNVHVKVSNLSSLYNRDLWLQIIALVEVNFTVKESVEVIESEEIIILTLL